MGIADLGQLLFDPIELLARGIRGVGLDDRRVGPRDLPRRRGHLVGDFEHDLAADLRHHLAADFRRQILMDRVDEGLQEDDRDGFHFLVDEQLPGPLPNFVLVEGNHRGAEHIDSLGHAPGQLAGDEGNPMLAILHMGDFGPLRPDEGLGAPTLGNNVLEASGDDDARLITAHIDDGIEHRGAGIDGGLDRFTEIPALLLRDPHIFEGFPEGFHIADAFVLGRSRGFADHTAALFIHNDHIGHGAACIASN